MLVHLAQAWQRWDFALDKLAQLYELVGQFLFARETITFFMRLHLYLSTRGCFQSAHIFRWFGDHAFRRCVESVWSFPVVRLAEGLIELSSQRYILSPVSIHQVPFCCIHAVESFIDNPAGLCVNMPRASEFAMRL